MGALTSTLGPQQINSLLPPELLHQILSLLAPRDLKTAVLACRLWREVGEAPGLWAWVFLRVTRENLATMPDRLATRRLLGVTGFVLERGAVELLKAAAWRSSHQHLRINLALALEPEGLARLMKRVNLTRLLNSSTSQHFQVSVGRAIR